MRRRSPHAQKKLWPPIILVCFALLVALGFIFGQDILDGWKSSQTEAKTRALYAPATAGVTTDVTAVNTPAAAVGSNIMPVPTATPAPSLEVTFDPELPPVETPPPVQEDFLELYYQNPHFIGWLTAGERIDYPVVWDQGDNDYYLHHDFFGKADKNGTLFLNGNNRFFPANEVWLIHGHNMRSGAMFGTLGKYRDPDYLCQYPLITFRTIYDEETVYYVPIAAFDASMIKGNREYFDITQIAFPNDDEVMGGLAAQTMATIATSPTPEKATGMPSPAAKDGALPATRRHSAAFAAYLDSLQEVSLWKSPVDVNVDDSLVILVTCSYTQKEGRFMLVCRKLREDETAESVTALFQNEK